MTRQEEIDALHLTKELADLGESMASILNTVNKSMLPYKIRKLLQADELYPDLRIWDRLIDEPQTVEWSLNLRLIPIADIGHIDVWSEEQVSRFLDQYVV